MVFPVFTPLGSSAPVALSPRRPSPGIVVRWTRRLTLGLALTTALSATAALPSASSTVSTTPSLEPAVASASIQHLRSSANMQTLGQPRVASGTTGTVTASRISLYSGPGDTYAIKGSMPLGTKLAILGESNGWYNVRTPMGYVGWSDAKYIAIDGAAPAPPPPAPGLPAPSYEAAEIAKRYLGYPYLYAAAGPNAFDCSGLTYYVYKQLGVTLPRSSVTQFNSSAGAKITTMAALQPGDLVFFQNTTSRGGISHVGIYVGNNQMVHASNPTTGVIQSSITSTYYTTRFAGGMRIYR